jgi:hypothetical protein
MWVEYRPTDRVRRGRGGGRDRRRVSRIVRLREGGVGRRTDMALASGKVVATARR